MNSSALKICYVSNVNEENEVTDLSVYEIRDTNQVYVPMHGFPTFQAASFTDHYPTNILNPIARNTVAPYLLVNTRGGMVFQPYEYDPICLKRYHWNFRWTEQRTNPFWENEAHILNVLRNFAGAVDIRGKHEIQGSGSEDLKFVLATTLECYTHQIESLQSQSCAYAAADSVAISNVSLQAPTLRDIFYYVRFHPQSARVHAEMIGKLSYVLHLTADAVFRLHKECKVAHMGLSMDEVLVVKESIEGGFFSGLEKHVVKLADFEFSCEFGASVFDIVTKRNVPKQCSEDVQAYLLSHLRMETVRERDLLLPPETWDLLYAALPSDYPRDLYQPPVPYSEHRGAYLPAYKDLWDLGQIYFQIFVGHSLVKVYGLLGSCFASNKHYQSIDLSNRPFTVEDLFRVFPSRSPPDVERAEDGERHFLTIIYSLAPYLNHPRYDAIVYRMIKFLHPHAPLRVQGWDIQAFSSRPSIPLQSKLFPPTFIPGLEMTFDTIDKYLKLLVSYIHQHQNFVDIEDDDEEDMIMAIDSLVSTETAEAPSDFFDRLLQTLDLHVSDQDTKHKILEELCKLGESSNEPMDSLTRTDSFLNFLSFENSMTEEEEEEDEYPISGEIFGPVLDF